jgi:hypothetical protein
MSGNRFPQLCPEEVVKRGIIRLVDVVYEERKNFRRKYGNIKECLLCGFLYAVHNHHVIPINYRAGFKDNKDIIAQLGCGTIPVCPNCHYLIHRGRISVYGLILKSKDKRIVRTKKLARLLKKTYNSAKVLVQISPFKKFQHRHIKSPVGRDCK